MYKRQASVLHDIGKIKTPDAILLKPGRLTDEEFEVMKQHTVAGCEIIVRIIGNVEHEEYVDIARKIARYHLSLIHIWECFWQDVEQIADPPV